MMKLSTAIRIGSMTTKQITGRTDDGGNGRCALGAAIDAMGGSRKDLFWWRNTILKMFPIAKIEVTHPVTGVLNPLYMVIFSLNDVWEWSRQRIADWVEIIENQVEAKETQKEAEICHC